MNELNEEKYSEFYLLLISLLQDEAKKKSLFIHITSKEQHSHSSFGFSTQQFLQLFLGFVRSSIQIHLESNVDTNSRLHSSNSEGEGLQSSKSTSEIKTKYDSSFPPLNVLIPKRSPPKVNIQIAGYELKSR
jgi:hypothetical protein